MRKVIFKKLIPPIWSNNANSERSPIQQFIRPVGNGWIVTTPSRWQEGCNGWFHNWGVAYEDSGEHGYGNYSVALVEDETGFIHEVLPDNLQFVESPDKQTVIPALVATGR